MNFTDSDSTGFHRLVRQPDRNRKGVQRLCGRGLRGRNDPLPEAPQAGQDLFQEDPREEGLPQEEEADELDLLVQDLGDEGVRLHEGAVRPRIPGAKAHRLQQTLCRDGTCPR